MTTLPPRDDGPTWVYRPYDARGRLLYAGMAEDVERRMDQHKFGPWYGDVAAMAVELYATRSEAAAAEREAIAAEWPLWNIRDSPWGGVVSDRMRQLDGYWRQDKRGRWHPVPLETLMARPISAKERERRFQELLARNRRVRRLTREAVSACYLRSAGQQSAPAREAA